MKIIKKLLNICFAVLFIVLTVPQNVKAEEFLVMSTVSIKANVPEEFTENITFILEEENTQVQFAFVLTKENQYEGSLSVLEKKAYFASAIIKSENKYKTDIEEKYEIEGEEFEIVFNVTPIIYSIENDEGQTPSWNDDEEAEVSDSGEIDPETGLPTAENVIKEFEEKVSFIEDDPNFSTFLQLYSGAMFEKYYLNADPMNTEEQWENMTEIDRFNYYITYYMPYTKMMNYEFSSANELIQELIAQKNLLSQIENGNIVYDAIVDVWRWHYSYWQNTGTFYNFYNYYDGINSKEPNEPTEPTVSETIELTDKDKKELEEAEIEIKEEEEEEADMDNPIILWIKQNWLTAVILLVAGISFLIVFLHNRKENISDESDK